MRKDKQAKYKHRKGVGTSAYSKKREARLRESIKEMSIERSARGIQQDFSKGKTKTTTSPVAKKEAARDKRLKKEDLKRKAQKTISPHLNVTGKDKWGNWRITAGGKNRQVGFLTQKAINKILGKK